MAITINGDGSISGISVGGLPDGTVDSDTLASGIDKTSISDSGDATAITIDSSERVGIGAAPAYLLDVHSTATSGTTVTANLSNDKYGVSTGYTALQIGTQYDDGSSRIVSRNNTGNQSELILQPHAASSGVWTDALTLTSDGTLKFNSGYGSAATAYGCRAWVNFDGTGTVSIRDSGNVSSISDSGTGMYNINFSTAMPDDDYATNAIARYLNGTGVGTTVFLDNNPATTATAQIVTVAINRDFATRDTTDVSVTVFR